MEDKEKSGIQISLGDLVSFFSCYCAFGVPVLFLFVFVGSSVHSSLIANFLPIWTPYTTYTPCTIYRGFPIAHKKWSICTPPIHPTPSTSGRTFAPTTLPSPCPLKAPRLTGQPLVALPISASMASSPTAWGPPFPPQYQPAFGLVERQARRG